MYLKDNIDLGDYIYSYIKEHIDKYVDYELEFYRSTDEYYD